MANRSKLEAFLYKKLKKDFPTLKVRKNDRILCEGLEIDILVPQLKVAIECNGVFHYKPIYGKKRLKQSQVNDKRKSEILDEKGYNLIIIKQDFSFSTQKANYYYRLYIKSEIQKRLS